LIDPGRQLFPTLNGSSLAGQEFHLAPNLFHLDIGLPRHGILALQR
jgi:hypothetical protein